MKRITRRPFTLTGLLIVVALCLGLAPRPTSAVRLTLTLADENATYGTGRFFRTGLTRDRPDGPGGVQLVPTTLQTSWIGTADLPIALASHTSAVYRDRIFVVGGKTLTGDTNNPVASTGVFFSTKLADPATGVLRPWTDQPALPSLPIQVANPASAVVTVGAQPFLFVMGGQRQIADLVDDVTTSRIFYYPITEDANGNLVVQSAWREITDQAQRLPYGTFANETNGTFRGAGVSSFGAVAVTVGSTPYIYTFGGFNRIYAVGGGYTDRYQNAVWRAAIAGTDGALTLNWGASAIGAFPYDSSVQDNIRIAGMASVTFTSPDFADTGVYLIGGTRCVSDCEANTAVLQADENAYAARIGADGSVNWLQSGNMSGTRTNHDAVQADGQVLVVAGRSQGAPSVSGGQGFVGAFVEGRARTVDDDLSLYRDPNAPTAPNFDLVTGFLGNAKPRMDHSMETLKGTLDSQFAYLIGGQVEEGQGNIVRASKEVIFGNLKTQPIPTDNVVSDGKYYSKVYDFGADATFFNFYPTLLFKRDGSNAVIDGQSVEVQYRIGTNEQSLGPWSTAVQGLDGRNTIPLPGGATGRYFQYMVSLYRSSTNAQAAPILDKVELDVNRNGFPNIQVAAQNGFSIGSINNLSDPIAAQVSIANNPISQLIPALNANWDAEGSFFVIMYRLGPGMTKPRPDWPTFGDPGIAFVEVGKSSMPANSQFAIPPSTWRQWCATPPSCPQVNDAYWRGIFNTIGDHNIYVMVDANGVAGGYGDVKEADDLAGGEADNVGGPYVVHVNEASKKTFIPTIYRVYMGSAAASDLGRMPWAHTIK